MKVEKSAAVMVETTDTIMVVKMDKKMADLMADLKVVYLVSQTADSMAVTQAVMKVEKLVFL